LSCLLFTPECACDAATCNAAQAMPFFAPIWSLPP
jgi:hypothetical protein